MTLFAVLLFSFAVADLPNRLVQDSRLPGALIGSSIGIAATVLGVWGLGIDGAVSWVAIVGLGMLVIAWGWVGSFGGRAGAVGTVVVLTLAAVMTVAVGGAVQPSGGEFGAWYSRLDWAFVTSVPPSQAAMGVAGFLFLTSSSNRVVSSVLQLAGTPTDKGEQRLKGGRLLGTMERWLLVGMVLAGEPAGAAVVFAAKGLLRFPTIRDSGTTESKRDGNSGWTEADYSEYFLVGTFASLLIAAAVAGLVLASK